MLAGLANNWSALKDRAEELLRLKKEMDTLKEDLLKTRGMSLSTELGDMDQLDERIRTVKVSEARSSAAERRTYSAAVWYQRGVALGIVPRCIVSRWDLLPAR